MRAVNKMGIIGVGSCPDLLVMTDKCTRAQDGSRQGRLPGGILFMPPSLPQFNCPIDLCFGTVNLYTRSGRERAALRRVV